MLNSSALCRQQEAHHRQIAADSPLEKVRKIALAAAKAWEIQAIEAEAREAGKRDSLSSEDAAIALEFRQEEDDGRDARTHGIPDLDKSEEDPLQQP